MPIRITVVFSPGPREVREVALQFEVGATVAQALAASDILRSLPEALCAEVSFGIWGSKVSPDRLLRDGDRVEVYRPLKVDPKTARRARFVAQGARGAGLFARKRPGAKAGY